MTAGYNFILPGGLGLFPIRMREYSPGKKAGNTPLADHPLFAHQLQAARKAKEIADLEATGGHIIRVGYRRRPMPDDQIRPRSPGRSTGLDLWAPSPLVGFLRNTTSYILPTLIVTPVSKTAVPRGPCGETLPDYPNPEKSVIGHFGYIERQDRASRKNDNEVAGHCSLEPVAHSANDYSYIERSNARDVSDGGAVSYVCTNIDANPERRKDFARAVYRHERLGKDKHKLLASPQDLQWWAEQAARPGVEAWVKEAARRLMVHERQVRKKGETGGNKKVIICEVNERQAYDRIVWCQSQPEWNAKHKQITFKSNIGGRVQYRFVFQLPYWISARERLEIVHKMARMMGKMGFMYVAAIHRPDAHNDERNYHVHIDAYDRPCKYNKQLKKWDIEIFEKKKNGSLKPTREPKIEGFARPLGGGQNRGHWAEVMRTFRERFCAFTNEVLERSATPSPFRYHPGKFQDVGLDLRSTKKLGGAQMAKEANGVRTPTGDQSAQNIWGDVFDAIYRRRKESLASVAARSRQVLASISKVADRVTQHQLKEEWSKLRKGEIALIYERCRFELAQAEIAMMRSRAETIMREAGRRGVGRDEGKAYRKSSLAPLRDVALREAEAHLALVDTFAPTKESIEAEVLKQKSERLRLGAGAEKLNADILWSEVEPTRVSGIERLSATTIAIPLQLPACNAIPKGGYEQLEVGRLQDWFEKHESDASSFFIQNGRLVISARQAVCSRLMKHCANPLILERLQKIARQLNVHEKHNEVSALPVGPEVSLEQANVQENGEASKSSEVAQPAPPNSEADTKGGHEGEDCPRTPEYICLDRKFVEEETEAGRAVNGELLNFFRHFMTAEKPAFYLHRDWKVGPPELLSFKHPDPARIVEQRLGKAANDDQVLRYIHRMLPTLPVGDPDEDDLKRFPLPEPPRATAPSSKSRGASLEDDDLNIATLDAALTREGYRGR